MNQSSKNTQFKFSIVEMITVVFIILLLMTLITPSFVKLKMNARTALCKNQLKQIGVLLTSYQTDNNGYFPNDDAETKFDYNQRISDLGRANTANNQLYSYWNGHLLPYIDTPLKSYAREAKVAKDGLTRWRKVVGSTTTSETKPPADPTTNGWAVVDDALKKGGFNDLKVFVCPEIHNSAVDVSVMKLYNGLRIPRISQLCDYSGFNALNNNYLGGGIPTTYLANELFFGLNNVWEASKNSYRVDQINDLNQKVLMVEGGVADPWGPNGNGEVGSPYYMINTYSAYTGGALLARFGKSGEHIQKLSYVHDNIEEFWIMNGAQWFSYYFPSIWGSFEWKLEFANKFNTQFEGKASMVMGSNYYSFNSTIGFDIVSYVNPYLDSESLAGGTIFDNFFVANPPGSSLKPFIPFVDEPNDYKYLVGNMNVLMGDNSVLTKDAGWLCNNRIKISMLNE